MSLAQQISGTNSSVGVIAVSVHGLARLRKGLVEEAIDGVRRCLRILRCCRTLDSSLLFALALAPRAEVSVRRIDRSAFWDTFNHVRFLCQLPLHQPRINMVVLQQLG